MIIWQTTLRAVEQTVELWVIWDATTYYTRKHKRCFVFLMISIHMLIILREHLPRLIVWYVFLWKGCFALPTECQLGQNRVWCTWPRWDFARRLHRLWWASFHYGSSCGKCFRNKMWNCISIIIFVSRWSSLQAADTPVTKRITDFMHNETTESR